MRANLKAAMGRLAHDRILWLSELVILLGIGLDYAFNQLNTAAWLYAGLVLMAVLTSWLLGRGSERGQALTIAASYLLASVYLIFEADIFGSAYLLMVLLILLSAHLLGRWGLWLSLNFLALIIVTASWYQFGLLNADLAYLMGVYWLGAAVIGGFFSYFHHKRSVSNPLAPDQTIEFERNRLLSLINSMADAVIATDNTGKILLYNGAVLDILNTNVSIENKYLAKVMVLRNPKGRRLDIIKQAQRADVVLKRDDLSFTNVDGQITRLYIDIAPIRASGVQKAGFIMLLRDITKEKSLDEEREEFISVTSHELRTPIAIAEANLSTALMPQPKTLPDNIHHLLEQAYNQILFLSDLINDLATLARAERTDHKIEAELIDPAKLIERLASDYQADAETKQLKLETKLSGKLPKLLSSTLYVREILQNFVSNAIKYTEKGSISLTGQAKPNGNIIFSVKDTGIGVSSSEQRKIFSKFHRAESPLTQTTRGTGLGLYITLKLAEKIGAHIWFESKLGAGSTFYLEVPPISAKHRPRRGGLKPSVLRRPAP